MILPQTSQGDPSFQLATKRIAFSKANVLEQYRLFYISSTLKFPFILGSSSSVPSLLIFPFLSSAAEIPLNFSTRPACFSAAKQHFLYLKPLPHGQRDFFFGFSCCSLSGSSLESLTDSSDMEAVVFSVASSISSSDALWCFSSGFPRFISKEDLLRLVAFNFWDESVIF